MLFGEKGGVDGDIGIRNEWRGGGLGVCPQSEACECDVG
jgi:hypothetical protein